MSLCAGQGLHVRRRSDPRRSGSRAHVSTRRCSNSEHRHLSRGGLVRRTPIVLVMTTAGLTGLALYRTRPVASHLAGPSLSLSAGSARSGPARRLYSDLTTSTPTSTSIPPTSTLSHRLRRRPPRRARVRHRPPSRPSRTTLAPVTTTTTTVPSTTTTRPATTRQATGEVVDYSYGDALGLDQPPPATPSPRCRSPPSTTGELPLPEHRRAVDSDP